MFHRTHLLLQARKNQLTARHRSGKVVHGCTYVMLRGFPTYVTCGYSCLLAACVGFIPRPRALRSRDLCRLDVRKAAAVPRLTGAPSPRMRRAGRAA